jgi:hypothetical protein
MSFLRHGEIYHFDGGAIPQDRAPAHRNDEFPAGYSLAGCSPAWPASASPAGPHLARKRRSTTIQFQRTAKSVLTVCLTPGDHPTALCALAANGRIACDGIHLGRSSKHPPRPLRRKSDPRLIGPASGRRHYPEAAGACSVTGAYSWNGRAEPALSAVEGCPRPGGETPVLRLRARTFVSHTPGRATSLLSGFGC